MGETIDRGKAHYNLFKAKNYCKDALSTLRGTISSHRIGHEIWKVDSFIEFNRLLPSTRNLSLEPPDLRLNLLHYSLQLLVWC